MPKLDGTGPNGKGPMTGRGSGYFVIPLNTTEQGLEFLRNQEPECTGSKDSRKE